MTRIALVGARGRMGRAVTEQAAGVEDIVIAAGVEVPGHPDIGVPFGEGALEADLTLVLDRVDVVLDFSARAGLAGRLAACSAAGRPFVCGTTGLVEEELAALRAAAARIPVVYAPNFSAGVNVLYRLATGAARMLGPDFDVEIVETHHRQKQDAPSGTAAHLARLLEQATAATRTTYGRDGNVGAKPVREIGVHSVRSGDAVGEHTVVFGGPGERLEITHRALSRAAFARGAVAAARFAHGRGPGYYTMADVLGPGD